MRAHLACLSQAARGGYCRHVDRRLEELVHEVPTTVRGPLALADWLAAHEVEQVVMEAAGVSRCNR